MIKKQKYQKLTFGLHKVINRVLKGCGLWIMDCGLRIADCGLWIVD
jgi:hypothetical protein